MSPEEEAKKLKEAQDEQVKAYKKLGKIKGSKEFEEFFVFLMKTVTDKMVWAFTTGKDGDNVKDWDDFCKVRGEIVARLHPIQEIYGADKMAQYLEKQLNEYYKQPE